METPSGRVSTGRTPRPRTPRPGLCEVITRSGTTSLYNHRWLDIDIDIPLSRACANCWWSVDYSLPAGASSYERAVWTVLIVGDPVHLLE